MLSSLSTHTLSLLVSRFLSSSSIRPAREGSWTLQLQLYHSQRLGRCGSRVGLRGRVGISSSSASNPQISRNSYLLTPPSPPLSNSFRPHPPTPQSLIRSPLPPPKNPAARTKEPSGSMIVSSTFLVHGEWRGSSVQVRWLAESKKRAHSPFDAKDGNESSFHPPIALTIHSPS